MLVVCSSDGYLSFFRFGAGALGACMQQIDLNSQSNSISLNSLSNSISLTHTHPHPHTKHTHPHTHTHTHTHTDRVMHVDAYLRMLIRTYVHTCVYTHIYTNINMVLHGRISDRPFTSIQASHWILRRSPSLSKGHCHVFISMRSRSQHRLN